MTVIVTRPTENLETFSLGGRFRPSLVHFSRRVDEIKTFFPNSVGLSVTTFRCVLFRSHISLLTTTLHVCPFKTKKIIYSYLIFPMLTYCSSSSSSSLLREQQPCHLSYLSHAYPTTLLPLLPLPMLTLLPPRRAVPPPPLMTTYHTTCRRRPEQLVLHGYF